LTCRWKSWTVIDMQVEIAGERLMKTIQAAFEALSNMENEDTQHEKHKPKLKYDVKNMTVYIKVLKNTAVPPPLLSSHHRTLSLAPAAAMWPPLR